MGKLRTSYTNKPKHKPSARPANNGKSFIKRSNNRPESDHEESEVITGGKTYQKAVQSRDRYKELAREALVSGDRVAAENYHQHADHYGRIINSAHEAEQEKLKLRKQREDARAQHSETDESSESVETVIAEPVIADAEIAEAYHTEAE